MIKKIIEIDSFDEIKNTEIFLKNPVILWNHDYAALPIGKCINIGHGKAECIFTDELLSFSEDRNRKRKFKKLIKNIKHLYPGYTQDGKLLELSIIDDH